MPADFTFDYFPSMGFYNDIKDSRLNPIPNNTIVYKTLTGIGITTAEIKEERNSIIILPNVPVIKGKQQKHVEEDNTFAVIEGITINDIVLYLIRKDRKPKKILTTPESFIKKVVKAFKRVQVDMYSEYFMLCDEAHKYILDNNYRDEIIKPFDYFFNFNKKAIVSATPLRFSDPRFLEHNFSKVAINPIYDIKKDIHIIHTNNIAHVLDLKVNKEPEGCYCIFYNSIDGIKSLIKTLSLEEESNIYCSGFSSRELNIEGYENVYSSFDKSQDLKKYNFFTSSFYNGLDIDLDFRPHLIMVTSVKFADHTTIDPNTDAIQIMGRFRKDVHSVTHITDTNNKLTYLTLEAAVEQFNISADVYKAINHLKLGAPNPFAQQLFDEALSRIKPYAELLNTSEQNSCSLEEDDVEDEFLSPQDNINHFKLDNHFNYHKVRSYYADFHALIEAYENTRRFNITHEIVFQKITKDDVLKRFGSSRTSQEVYKDITNILNDLEGLRVIDPYEFGRQFQIFNSLYHQIVNAYDKLGPQRMEALRFNHRAIQREVIKDDAVRLLNMHSVVDAVYNEIPKGSKMTSVKVKAILQSIYNTYIVNKTAKATDIEHFYKVRKNVKVKVVRKKQVQWDRGFEMQEPLFNVYDDYKRS